MQQPNVKCGSVELRFCEDGDLKGAVIRIVEWEILLTPNAIETLTLLAALRHIFDGARPYSSPADITRIAQTYGSTWTYIMTLADKQEIVWLVAGPISVYVATARMREIYDEMLKAFELAGIGEVQSLTQDCLRQERSTPVALTVQTAAEQKPLKPLS